VETDVARRALTRLASSGEVVRLGPELHFAREAVDDARERIVSDLQEHEQATAAQLRDAIGVSRKYAIPLLEYFDAQAVTRRVGDERVLGRRA
jgi:selenocysteine-specific elongation factor